MRKFSKKSRGSDISKQSGNDSTWISNLTDLIVGTICIVFLLIIIFQAFSGYRIF